MNLRKKSLYRISWLAGLILCFLIGLHYSKAIAQSVANLVYPSISYGINNVTGTATSGFQSISGGGCSTTASAGATCNTLLTFTTPFNDSSEICTCSCQSVGAGTPVISTCISTSATQVTIQTMAVTAAVSSCGNVAAVCVHH